MDCKWKSNQNKKCSREADNSGYCIFHKRNKTKEENNLLIKTIITEKISDFSGFIIEEDFVAKNILNYEYKSLNFSEVEFLKSAIFDEYKFRADVFFNYTNFKETVSFRDSVFLENCNFYKTIFDEEYVNKKIFERLKFKGQNLIVNKVENLPRLDGAVFSQCSKVIIRDIVYLKKGYLAGKINYRIARIQAKKIGDYESIGYYYYKERTYGTKVMKKDDYPTYNEYLSARFFDILSKYTIGYGERPWNILIITIIIISVFAFFYMFTEINKIFSYNPKEIIKIYMDFWYFSMVTFATVGYGDIVVGTILGKILVSIEVFLGVTVAATWASVVIKRMIR
ncbi:potassium channel family protein [Asaccharospora irregularis]|uniref:Pentapeptide repeat-containing protein n=1 Tax=Asaccharospora irregularis DSM 2635 TaxID=1121321 RepID=A0A1M5Q2T5_9FIRM|nr:potassium channel family protein [Asaccharospora irregularis]SHH08587.1 Pentapeptide repeat-containing protein [Asaccharospora irregularis DSM 2635]